MKRLIIPFVFLTLLGAGCFGFGSTDEPGSPPNSVLEQAFESATTSFGEASTSTSGEGLNQKRYDVNEIFAKDVSFDPPAGHWVYFSEVERNYWLMEGEVPESGSGDPSEATRGSRVALIQTMTFTEDYPTWDRFKFTMAQLSCLEGTTSENLIGCLDEPMDIISGKTVGGYTYEAFKLQRVRKVDQSFQGTRTFIMVRLGASSKHGILFVIEDGEALGVALELAKSMRPI